ncbi:MAG: IS66 family insertion sequence element accessory protein TnpB [Rhodocyclaceae bacterium]|nr:IS66 family insertion sequence element accessory protein TnpB [Rhodocyclaceae bacterium]
MAKHGIIMRRVRRDEQQWKVLVQAQAGSGLSVSEYCLREAVSEASFYRWRALVGGKASAKNQPMGLTKPVQAMTGFLDLGVLGAASGRGETSDAAARLELKLDLGGGLILHLVRG